MLGPAFSCPESVRNTRWSDLPTLAVVVMDESISGRHSFGSEPFTVPFNPLPGTKSDIAQLPDFGEDRPVGERRIGTPELRELREGLVFSFAGSNPFLVMAHGFSERRSGLRDPLKLSFR